MKSGKRLGFLIKLANAAKRTPDEAKLVGDVLSIRAKYLLFGSAFVALFVIFVPIFSQQMDTWNDVKPNVAISKDLWRVYLGKAAGVCGYNAEKSPGCPANPHEKT